MPKRPNNRLQEADTREGMKQINVWLPEEMHRALVQARAEEGASLNWAIREAVRAWLARREAARKSPRRRRDR